MSVCAHVWAYCGGTQPLQFGMTIDGKKVFVKTLVARRQIKLLQVPRSLHTAAPSYHEIIAKFFALFVSEFIIEVTILAIKLGHLVLY